MLPSPWDNGCPARAAVRWRLSLAVLTQCVPVIIQPNVTQPFEDILDGTPYAYHTFSLRLGKADIPKLPEILRSVTDEAICRYQAQLARVYRALLWQQPHGTQHASAYDLMQIGLCRRAKALAQAYRRNGTHPAAYLARNELKCADSLEAAGIRFE